MTEPWNFTEGQRRQFREAQAGAKARTAERCAHCGQPIVKCPNPGAFCKGWIHEGYPDKPVGAHYCDGRSINPVAEPNRQQEKTR